MLTPALTPKRYDEHFRFLYGGPTPGKEVHVIFYFVIVPFSEPASYYWFYGDCRHALCMCDSEAVQCYKRTEFNPSLMNYSRDKCLSTQ